MELSAIKYDITKILSGFIKEQMDELLDYYVKKINKIL